LNYTVPIRRLRWKDGRNMALRGDDIVGYVKPSGKKIRFLKGESKSRAALAQTSINEAAKALDHEDGRPSRHSILYVATRLRELYPEETDLPEQMETAVLQSFKGHKTEHLLFVLTGNNPSPLLSKHLDECRDLFPRQLIGARISDHGEFIKTLYDGLEDA
jgi:hypothetical protein